MPSTGDQKFVSQTYVAVQPDGLDPCDLRHPGGRRRRPRPGRARVPLYRFVLSNVIGKYDLDRADGRVDALREAAADWSRASATVEGRRVRP